MSRFLKITSLFLSPFIIILILNILVDPFSYQTKNFLNLKKQEVALPMDYRLYRLNEFRNNPKNRIIFGDSRMYALKEDYVTNVAKNSFANLAYGAGSLAEVFKTIDYVKELTEIEEIVLGIPFNMFDASMSRERVSRALQTIKNPSNYYFSFMTTRASFNVLLYNITGNNIASEQPNKTKNQFWVQQLKGAEITYSQYKYPLMYVNKLLELSSYCRDNNIVLKIIIPPTHIDLQNKVVEFDLVDDYKNYKSFLSQLGEFYDFDNHNLINSDSSFFKDPYHFNEDYMKIIVDKVWNAKH